ncbi:unnamed protein product [Arctogadus glacialis]
MEALRGHALAGARRRWLGTGGLYQDRLLQQKLTYRLQQRAKQLSSQMAPGEKRWRAINTQSVCRTSAAA